MTAERMRRTGEHHDEASPSFRSASLPRKGGGRSNHAGQVVFAQGDPADAVLYLQSGKIKVTVLSQQGKEAVLALLGAGDSSVKAA